MIHFAQNNDIIIGVDFGHGNDCGEDYGKGSRGWEA